MTALEIILLLIGIICVAASFILFLKVDGPETAAAAANVGLSNKQKEDIKKQISQAYEEQMEEMTDVVYERTETALEKLSNQKIQEFSDYSETVFGELNKSHTEVMFLYDMLNEKSKEVHNNIRDISLTADQLNMAKENAAAVMEQAENISRMISEETAKAADIQQELAAIPRVPEPEETEEKAVQPKKTPKPRVSKKTPLPVVEPDGTDTLEALDGTEEPLEPPVKKAPRKRAASKAAPKNEVQETQEQQEPPAPSETPVRTSAVPERPRTRTRTKPSAGSAQVTGGNKKEAILALYREGRSNVDIAKTLGLGIGEVRLVIDLFKGRQE